MYIGCNSKRTYCQTTTLYIYNIQKLQPFSNRYTRLHADKRTFSLRHYIYIYNNKYIYLPTYSIKNPNKMKTLLCILRYSIRQSAYGLCTQCRLRVVTYILVYILVGT